MRIAQRKRFLLLAAALTAAGLIVFAAGALAVGLKCGTVDAMHPVSALRPGDYAKCTTAAYAYCGPSPGGNFLYFIRESGQVFVAESRKDLRGGAKAHTFKGLVAYDTNKPAEAKVLAQALESGDAALAETLLPDHCITVQRPKNPTWWGLWLALMGILALAGCWVVFGKRKKGKESPCPTSP